MNNFFFLKIIRCFFDLSIMTILLMRFICILKSFIFWFFFFHCKLLIWNIRSEFWMWNHFYFRIDIKIYQKLSFKILNFQNINIFILSCYFESRILFFFWICFLTIFFSVCLKASYLFIYQNIILWLKYSNCQYNSC